MTKDEILNMLRSASAPISGEEMSRALGVSRAAVWKAVDQLRQEGYAIEAATRRGYRLAALPDRLDAAVIAVRCIICSGSRPGRSTMLK